MPQSSLFFDVDSAPNSEPSPVICDRCGCGRFLDVPIHGGDSARRDCARCGRTLGFSRWQGQACATRPQDTRAAAAAAIGPITPSQRRRVFDFIAARGERGATDEEIALALSLSLNSLHPRRGELRTGGQIRATGRTRLSKAGRDMTVWTWTGKPLD